MGGQRHGRKRYNRIPKVPPADDQHSNGQAEVIHLQSPKLNNSFQAMPVPSSMKSNQLTRTYSEDSISEDKINEAIEDTFMEYIQYQTEKIHDIIDDLDQLNKSSWSNTANLGDGITKLTSIKEKLVEIKSRSLDLPEFWDRRPLKDHADYSYVRRILVAWNGVPFLVAPEQLRAASADEASFDDMLTEMRDARAKLDIPDQQTRR